MSRILVGVDGTPSGDAALLWALQEADRGGSDVLAVTAWQAEPLLGDVYGLGGEMAPDQAATQTVELAVKRVRESTGLDGVPVTPRAMQGPAALVLEQAARDADLLVVGRRHESAAARVALGSVSSAALHHVDCPVVVVPAHGMPGTGTGRVVVGVDESDGAKAALRWATARAGRDGSALVLVRVRSAFVDALRAPEGVPHVRELDAVELGALADLVRRAPGGADLDVRAEIHVGHAARTLEKLVQPGDVLVVGSRSRGTLAGWLLGSTSTALVHHALVPVVVVREHDRRPPS